ncbi:hypothetical protein acdb102_33170 [Acidothermaceae bacterium B102]|nr:hypothetical protein acdb102_33170 [Acidothermaceae bacterium B102]
MLPLDLFAPVYGKADVLATYTTGGLLSVPRGEADRHSTLPRLQSGRR